MVFAGFAADAVSAAEVVRAFRTWPATEYTRVTLESANALKYSITIVKDPERLVVDLENVDIANIPMDPDRFKNDPYVKAMRVGRFKPGVLRMVFDLKDEVRPQVFALTPVGEYGHRLVLDIYPVNPPDPLLALLQKSNPPLAAPAPAPSAAPAAAPSLPPAAAPNTPPVATPAPTEAPRPAEVAKPDAVKPDAATAKSAPATRAPESAIAKSPSAPSAPANESRSEPAKSAKAPTPRPPAAPNPLQRTLTIVIDAGHGGEDPGAKGARGTYEKNVTMAIAKRLKAMIDAEPNMRAVLTRDGDYYVPLNTRVDKARRVRGDLFVSIHADSFVHPDARGSSVFVLSERGATSSAARWLAKRENESDLIGGVNLDNKDKHVAQTLLDLSQTAQIADSLKLGRAVLIELGGINRLHKNYVEQASFAVLKAPDIPSILVETAFISNPDEEKRLGDEAYQQKLARALFNGLKSYFAKNPPIARSTIALAEPETLTQPNRPALLATSAFTSQ